VLNYLLRIRLSIVLLLSFVLAAGSLTAHAQVVPAATKSQFSLTVGGLASAFQPDYDAQYNGNWAEASPYRLYGFGAYTDVKFSRWVQIEGEARWLRFNQFDSIYEDNYLIGPRIPIHHFHVLRATPYAKALIGLANINLSYVYAGDGVFANLGDHKFTDLALGAGVDLRLTRRFTIRAFDFEYQDYFRVIETSQGHTLNLHPYGASVGVGYKIF
jgi:opacity protein-like surface antigen